MKTTWTYEKSLTAEREAHAATKAELAIAERDRDRWKSVYQRNYGVSGSDAHGWWIYAPSKDCNGREVIASGPILEAALDAAFAQFPLEAK